MDTHTSRREADVFYPRQTLEAACFEEDLGARREKLERPMAAWTSDAEGVPRRVAEEVGWRWEGARHFPDPALVVRFGLSGSGRPQEGLEWIERPPELGEAEVALRDAIAAVGGGRGT